MTVFKCWTTFEFVLTAASGVLILFRAHAHPSSEKASHMFQVSPRDSSLKRNVLLGLWLLSAAVAVNAANAALEECGEVGLRDPVGAWLDWGCASSMLV